MPKPRRLPRLDDKDQDSLEGTRSHQGEPLRDNRVEITKPVTTAINQSPFTLLQEIQQGRLDQRALSRDQRRTLLTIMAHGKQTVGELAHYFGCHPGVINKDVKAIRQELGAEGLKYTRKEVLGQLMAYAERCTAGALKNEDNGLAWTIQRDLARHMVELGLLDEDKQDGVRITIESLGKNYERAKRALAFSLDPALTGEVVSTRPLPQILALPTELPDQVDAPRAEVVVAPETRDPDTA